MGVVAVVMVAGVEVVVIKLPFNHEHLLHSDIIFKSPGHAVVGSDSLAR